jgi:LysM repeat protein
MAASGSPFPSPRACPFVALELDRDRRSERPDYRHRCFAEPAPAPRSIAHQESYCLSPNFAACPIFQDWAVRAAAAPVAARVSTPTGQTTAAASGAAAGAPADDEPEAARDEPATEPPLTAEPAVEASQARLQRVAEPAVGAPPAVEPPIGEPPLVEPPPVERETIPTPDRSAWGGVTDAEQLSVFSAGGAADDDEPRSSMDQPDAGYAEPTDVPLPQTPPDYVPPPSRPEPTARQTPAEDAVVPAFLAGRAPRPAGATSPAPPQPGPPRSSDRVTRDEVVPSWDVDGRYGAVRAEQPRDGGSRLDNVLTAIAVVAILLLGVAGVIFLPGLLAGGGPARTPGASFVVSSARPTAVESAAPTASVALTVAPPTEAPTVRPSVSAGPVGSPRLYRVRVGDSLASIAARFRLSVEELIAANPDIVDPNYVQVGQTIIIPRPPRGND